MASKRKKNKGKARRRRTAKQAAAAAAEAEEKAKKRERQQTAPDDYTDLVEEEVVESEEDVEEAKEGDEVEMGVEGGQVAVNDGQRRRLQIGSCPWIGDVLRAREDIRGHGCLTESHRCLFTESLILSVSSRFTPS